MLAHIIDVQLLQVPQPSVSQQPLHQSQMLQHTAQPQQHPSTMQYQHVFQTTLQQQQPQGHNHQTSVQYQSVQQPVTALQTLSQQQGTTNIANGASLPTQPSHQQAPVSTPALHVKSTGTPPSTPGREIPFEKTDVQKQWKMSAKPPASFDSKGVGSTDGLGKVLYFLDQMKSEVIEADRNIKSLNTDLKCLREKNKELEAKLRDTEKRLMEEKVAREAVETKVKLLKKRFRDLKELKSAECIETNEVDETPLAGEFITESLPSPPSDNVPEKQGISSSLASLDDLQLQRSTNGKLSSGPVSLSNSFPDTQVIFKSNDADYVETDSPIHNDDTSNYHQKARIVNSVVEGSAKLLPLSRRGSCDHAGYPLLDVTGTGSNTVNNVVVFNITPTRSRDSSSDAFDPLLKSINETLSADDKGCQTNGQPNASARSQHDSPVVGLHQTGQMGHHIRQQSSPNIGLGQLTMDATINQPGIGYINNNGLQLGQNHTNMMMNQNGMMIQMSGLSMGNMGNGMTAQGLQQSMMGNPQAQLQNNWTQQQYPINQQQTKQQQQHHQQQWVQNSVYQQEQQMVNQQQQIMMQAQQKQRIPQNQYKPIQASFRQQAVDPFNTLASRQQQNGQQSLAWSNLGS